MTGNRGRPAKVVSINAGPKKFYEVRITEREMVGGKHTGRSIHATTFQIKDYEGYSCVEFVKVRLMAAFLEKKNGLGECECEHKNTKIIWKDSTGWKVKWCEDCGAYRDTWSRWYGIHS